MDCRLESGLKAVAGQPAAVLSLHNPSDQPRRLYWIDFQGHRKAYGNIAPGGDRKQTSSVGNHWVVTDEADQCVALFATSASAAPFVIAAPGATAPTAPQPAVAAMAMGSKITPEGFDTLFPPDGGAAGAPTSTIILAPEGPMMVLATIPPPDAASAPAGPPITLDALNTLLFPPGDGCGAPPRVTVRSPVGSRIVSVARAPVPGRCGLAAAPTPTASPGAAGTTNK